MISILVGLSLNRVFAQRDGAPDSLTQILRRKQMELDATQAPSKTSNRKAEKARPAPSRASGTQFEMSATVPARNPGGEDRLTQLLRQKQQDLDATERNVSGDQRYPFSAKLDKSRAMNTQPRGKESRPKPARAGWPNTRPAEEDNLLEVLRSKQNELDAQTGATRNGTMRPQPSAEPARPRMVRAIPRVEEVLPTPAAPPLSQPAVNAASNEQLADILRRKEAELDAKENANRPLVPARKLSATKSEAAKKQAESEKRIQKIEAEIRAKEEAMERRRGQPNSSAVGNASLYSPPPDPATKEGRLAELLRKYRADEITPHDYHLERAKIIAEP